MSDFEKLVKAGKFAALAERANRFSRNITLTLSGMLVGVTATNLNVYTALLCVAALGATWFSYKCNGVIAGSLDQYIKSIAKTMVVVELCDSARPYVGEQPSMFEMPKIKMTNKGDGNVN